MEKFSGQIGKKIREYRKQAGLTQEDLALSAGITCNFLGDIERGVKKPSIDTLESVLSVLKISLQDFFSNQPNHAGETSRRDKLAIELSCLTDDELSFVQDMIRRLRRLRRK